MARAQPRRAARAPRDLSRTDPLTGCLNRRGFEERLAPEVGAADRTPAPLGLLLVDLDDFKAVNDTRGHAAGDELLAWVAATLGAGLRPLDAVGRLGGDEFAVLVPRTSRPELDELAERLRAALGGRVGASVGVAAAPHDGAMGEELLRRGDARLYARKHARFARGAPGDLAALPAAP
ncbi:MAG: GGDEF domain-containing protein [Actinomycetota bacterium]|nr:GGDEF domain-containing protein [Actinomycetota bacterium]